MDGKVRLIGTVMWRGEINGRKDEVCLQIVVQLDNGQVRHASTFLGMDAEGMTEASALAASLRDLGQAIADGMLTARLG
jgi:hypothetical protein